MLFAVLNVRACGQCAAGAGDEHFVFVISDADLQRYNIQPEQLGAIMTQVPAGALPVPVSVRL